jgi:hypothetical protein
MTTIELKNCPNWKVDLRTDETVQNDYGYPFKHTYNFRREKDAIFFFRSLEELHPTQLERLANLYVDGENAGRRAEKKAFEDQVHRLLDISGLRPLLVTVLRDLMGGHRI